MKLFKKIILIIISIIVIPLCIVIFNNAKNPSNIRAFGDLKVDFGNPPVDPGDPVFTISDFKPGDCEEREITVTNDGDLKRFIAVKGIKTEGVQIEDNPLLEEGIYITINGGINDLYGGNGNPKTVKEFLDDSADDGVKLGILEDGDSQNYFFEVCFPKEAGNEFQQESVIFDLIFGIITSDHLVINEVYYWPDKNHGTDGLKDCQKNNNAVNINTGAGSVNSASILNINQIIASVKQKARVLNIVTNSSNTGGNTGNSSTQTGNISSTVIINNNVNNSTIKINCGATSDEWIELFNPTNHDISLKNWTLEDNSGNKSIIHANKIIKAGEFAWVVKSASTKKYWNIPKNTLIVEIGNWIGDGLDNEGDHVILRNPSGTDIDNIGWGTDSVPDVVHTDGVPQGHSIERIVPGFDTDNGTNFEDRFPPTPGQ